MENINDQESIDSKYIILDKKGFGATADVYLVKEVIMMKFMLLKSLKNVWIYFVKKLKY